jgi:glutathionylspermidine synthase
VPEEHFFTKKLGVKDPGEVVNSESERGVLWKVYDVEIGEEDMVNVACTLKGFLLCEKGS